MNNESTALTKTSAPAQSQVSGLSNHRGRISALLISPGDLATVTQLAKIAKASGLAKVTDEVQASFIILKGLELGVPPFTALDGIFVTERWNKKKNRNEVSLGLTVSMMLGLVQSSGQLEDIQIPNPKDITDSATVTVKRKGQSPFSFTFTLKDAKTQGLLDKYNWETMQAIMLMNRAISGAIRPVFADILKGLYLLEEIAPDMQVDESGAPVELPKLDSNRVQPTTGSNVTPFPATGTTWLTDEAKDKIRGWLRQKYDMSYEEGLKLVGLEGQDWDMKFSDGKAVGAAVVEALKNAPPAKSKMQTNQPPAPQSEPETDEEPVDSHKPADTWTDQAALDFTESLWLRFERGQEDFLDKLGKQAFNKDFASPKAAWAACVNVVLKENWPVVVDSALYNGSYITFQGPLQIRMYGRSSKFKEMVGDTYYEANGIGAWGKTDKPYEIEPLRVTWERKGSDNTQYLTATKCEPVYIEETENGEPTYTAGQQSDQAEPSEDPEMDELLAYFGPKES